MARLTSYWHCLVVGRTDFVDVIVATMAPGWVVGLATGKNLPGLYLRA